MKKLTPEEAVKKLQEFLKENHLQLKIDQSIVIFPTEELKEKN